MQYTSTRGGPGVSLERAIMSGTAPDGGLYVPASLPRFQAQDFAGHTEFADIARILLTPFYAGSSLASRLPAICEDALNFPVPLRALENDAMPLSVLEMFHGPTAAFKDVGARFLAANMAEIVADGVHAQAPVTILVATSGDTGGAVAAAYYQRPGLRVVVLFPDGRVSPRQQHQLTCWGKNVVSLAVRGEFDDCQRLVKQAFADTALREQQHLCSANSINVGRLLPQAAYYAKASLEHWRDTGKPLNFVVPTGNLGNGFACVWARRMGLPIDKVVFATNANTTIRDYLSSGNWSPRASIATLASAMDVGDPSNMERLRALLGDADAIGMEISARSVDDEAIRRTIQDEYRRHAIAWCPHTATGLHVYREMPEALRRAGRWAVVATAHAAKFDTIVEPLLGIKVPPPPELAELLSWPAEYRCIDAQLDQLVAQL
jgi:threonine synthase